MTTHRAPASVASWLRQPGADDDKYRRGVLGVRTGAPEYPGAAVLSVTAAWRTGVGVLRYVPPASTAPRDLGLPTSAAAVLAARPETVFGASERANDAWLIGSGTDPVTRTPQETAQLRELIDGSAPVVVDAGALDLVGTTSAPLLLTPHAGEFARLWDAAGLGPVPPDLRDPTAVVERAAATERLASALGSTVLLKGSITVCASPDAPARYAGPATPWLASAGTGDVLAGILGALLATHAHTVREDSTVLAELGIAGALLHDRAARIAAGEPPESSPQHAGRLGRPVTALDVAEAIPAAFAQLASPGEPEPTTRLTR
ncbi:NAD(P)HX epimerase / NAD(P)HX dehydratase [Leucobacter sp. 7(1)]|uniref:ADP-dependent NAD(P)H-hydrate dehydratase n=1 Tax=Leucobacter sp. 7(1) TaxID=1255613 RepID=UPI00097EBC37|nr:ADP/ATP-dependent (S)-NAD(P)H-hydrate dehydratase [Leucobacter sp. 7(1)]SJN09420.1 NAD(P)HX epimerase / NAD(P)HX dehydratase [Leucobacter sp. 7(1)]